MTRASQRPIHSMEFSTLKPPSSNLPALPPPLVPTSNENKTSRGGGDEMGGERVEAEWGLRGWS